MFWRSSLLIGAVGIVISLVVALNSKRAFRSETTVIYRDTIQTKEGETASQRAARLGPKLKDLLYARPRLEQVIREFNLFPDKVRRSMFDAIEEMHAATTFKARSGDSFVISFTYEDRDIAQQVTARLTSLMIDEYNRQNLDAATLNRDFLKRELAEANGQVDEASRALATFLAHNPQFQWGLNDSPYAPNLAQALALGARGALPVPAPAPVPAAPAVAAGPQDPVLSQLQAELARVDAQLSPPPVMRAGAGAAPALPTSVLDAQKQRDAAAATLATAQAALAERLITVTPLHPDAISGKAKVEAARQNLAAAEAALRSARAGVLPEAPAGDANAPPLDASQREALSRRKASLLRQMAERRAALTSGDRAAAKAAKEPAAGDPAASKAADKPAAKEPAASEPVAKKAPDVVELETEWHRLRLELDRARDQLRVVQHNAHAAEISADAVENKSQKEMQILEPAYRPVRPDRGRGRVFLIGAAVAVLCALGYAAARVLLNDTLLDEGDIAALGGPPMLVSLPCLPESTAAKVEPVEKPAVARIPSAPPPPPGDATPPQARGSAPPPAAGRSAYRPDPALRAPIVCPPPAPQAALEAWTSDQAEPISPASPDLAGDVEDEPPTAPRPFATTLRLGTRIDTQGAAAPEAGVTAAQAASRPAVSLTVVRRAALIEAVFDEPEVEVVGGVDALHDDRSSRLLHATPAAIASLRVLRHRIEQKRGTSGSFVVSVLSPGPGEGKSLLAAQLAMTLAEAERARVVLVEGNLERPAVASTLGVRVPEGSSLSAQVRQRMQGRSRPWGVVRLSPSLSVFAEAGQEAVYPAALHSTYLEAAFRALRRSFDYVVVDGPSVLGSGDANVIESLSDGVLMVARAAETTASALSRSTQQLGDRRILGVVLNGVVQPEQRAPLKAAA